MASQKVLLQGVEGAEVDTNAGDTPHNGLQKTSEGGKKSKADTVGHRLSRLFPKQGQGLRASSRLKVRRDTKKRKGK